jgi:hypothetical protein
MNSPALSTRVETSPASKIARGEEDGDRFLTICDLFGDGVGSLVYNDLQGLELMGRIATAEDSHDHTTLIDILCKEDSDVKVQTIVMNALSNIIQTLLKTNDDDDESMMATAQEIKNAIIDHDLAIPTIFRCLQETRNGATWDTQLAGVTLLALASLVVSSLLFDRSLAPYSSYRSIDLNQAALFKVCLDDDDDPFGKSIRFVMPNPLIPEKDKVAIKTFMDAFTIMVMRRLFSTLE